MNGPNISKLDNIDLDLDISRVDQEVAKEYKFVHFTITDHNGDNKFITLILFHLDEQRSESRLDSDALNYHNTSAFESNGQTQLCTKMRTFFETKQENSVPIAVC